MPIACQEVERAVDDLQSSTVALKSDGNDMVQRQIMINGAKGFFLFFFFSFSFLIFFLKFKSIIIK